MKLIRHIALLLLMAGAQLQADAQGPVFSQYYSSGLYLNPSLAGLEKDILIGMNYRSQWSSLGTPFSTFQFSFIRPLVKPGVHVKHLGGVGASLLSDVAGPNGEFKTHSVLLSGAYNFHLTRYGNNILAVGLQVGGMQQRVNYDELQWSSQYSPGMGFDPDLVGESGTFNNQTFTPIVNLGMTWYYTTRGRLSMRSTSAFTGFSVSNLFQPMGFVDETKGASLLLYKIHGGTATIFRRKFELSPNYLIQYQNQSLQVNLGAYYGYYLQPPHLSKSKATKLMVGAWYRLQDAFIVSFAFSNRNWNFGVSYDSNVSSLGRNLGYASAYEVSLAYKIVVNKGFKRFSSPLI